MARIAVLDKEKCRSKICGFLCQKVCPRVRMGDETITVDEEGRFPVISEELCVGCGICVNKCPFDALTIVNLPHETGVLSHQYGKNGFRLYGLPIPRKGAVVGIVGPNGIGKSTAVKILSGQITPNLGHIDREPGWDEVIKEYRGNEVQSYLQQLRDGSVEVVCKPQDVSIISKAKKGKVADLLKAIPSNSKPRKPSNNPSKSQGNKSDNPSNVGDNSRRLEELRDRLELGSFLDKNVQTLSGGELQRLAIAVALMRDADVYFFDEPSSYLDIRQRLNVAKIIRDLAEKEKKAVVVVEHDLIVLDYLSDYVQIAYGHKAAYGVFSQLKNTRVGINEYLSGYLKNENVRISDTAIKFEEAKTGVLKSDYLLCEYPKISKKYPEFSLTADEGKLYNEIIVGALGPNAIGKTTMMRILAGEEKNDETKKKVDFDVRISYKPQYLVPVDKTVREVLQAVTKDLYKSHYKREVLEPMELEGLLDSKLENLSGGELQRVAIAECISREADIYLLDEPSAYLDVQQRLKTSKAVRQMVESRKKSAIVIDHDIAFIDYVSDQSIVFSGEPGKSGHASSPQGLKDGMNKFLKELQMTFRRDKETRRPRANKPGSQMDKQQRAKGEYYYSKLLV